MLGPDFDRLIAFASSGAFEAELRQARADYEARTGELFDSDLSYERRITSFLEWYAFDRPLSFRQHLTPARVYIDSVAPSLTTPELTKLRRFTRTQLSIFEYRGFKPKEMRVVDLLTGQKLSVAQELKPIGLEPGDVFEARLIPCDEGMRATESLRVYPRAARKAVVRLARRWRAGELAVPSVDVVQRVQFLTNRCERYRHLPVEEVFSSLASGFFDGAARRA